MGLDRFSFWKVGLNTKSLRTTSLELLDHCLTRWWTKSLQWSNAQSCSASGEKTISSPFCCCVCCIPVLWLPGNREAILLVAIMGNICPILCYGSIYCVSIKQLSALRTFSSTWDVVYLWKLCSSLSCFKILYMPVVTLIYDTVLRRPVS